jgi:hypothetical protein
LSHNGHKAKVNWRPFTQEDDTMLFMLESQPRPGVTRERMAEHFTGRLNPASWELIRHGVVSNLWFKTGSEIGFYAVLSAPSLEEAQSVVKRHTANEALFDVKIVPVNQFPHFD